MALQEVWLSTTPTGVWLYHRLLSATNLATHIVTFSSSTKARKHYLCLFAGLDAATSAKAAASRAADTAKNGEDAAKVFGAERRIFSKVGVCCVGVATA